MSPKNVQGKRPRGRKPGKTWPVAASAKDSQGTDIPSGGSDIVSNPAWTQTLDPTLRGDSSSRLGGEPSHVVSTLVTNVQGRTATPDSVSALSMVHSVPSEIGSSQDPNQSLNGLSVSNLSNVDLKLLKSEAHSSKGATLKIATIKPRFRQLKELMICHVKNYGAMTLGGGTFFWDDDAWTEQIPVCNRISRTYYAYTLRTIAQLILVLEGHFQAAKDAEKNKFTSGSGRPPPKLVMEIEQMHNDWSDKDTAFVTLWKRLQEYWNALPKKADEGRAKRRLEWSREKMQPENDPPETEMRCESPMSVDSETDTDERKTPGTNTTSAEIVDSEDEATVLLSPGDLRDKIAAVYTPITHVDGCVSPGDLRKCSESMRKIARKVGLSEEDQDMLCYWALSLVREQSSLLEDAAVDALLGAFREALDGRLPLRINWPQYKAGLDDLVYAVDRHWAALAEILADGHDQEETVTLQQFRWMPYGETGIGCNEST